jgi:hypothetical protein
MEVLMMITHFRTYLGAALALAVMGALILWIPGAVNARPAAEDIAQADDLFRQGQFDKAWPLYAQIAGKEPSDYRAVLGLGRISLLRNDLASAETWLKKAKALKPEEKEPQALMGEMYYRRDDYEKAAPFFEAVGQKAKADKLRAFQGKTPFLIESGPETTSVKFLRTDPLPLVKLTLNGREGTFLIDTGGWELHVNASFAEKCGIQPLAEMQTATYAGGKKAAISHALADTVGLGEFTLRNVPVVIPQGPGGGLADGVIGTVVLYHFLFTLDYPGGQLILRRNTPEISKAVRAEPDSAGAFRMPFWLAGDHNVYAWGTVNGAGPYLFFVDTGMGGGGFDCPEYVIKEASIKLSEQGFTGRGGGGPVTVYPFTVDLTLGGARETNVLGLHGAIPMGSEERFGFRTGGLISHGFFRPYAVTFDFRSMTLYLKKAAS